MSQVQEDPAEGEALWGPLDPFLLGPFFLYPTTSLQLPLNINTTSSEEHMENVTN